MFFSRFWAFCFWGGLGSWVFGDGFGFPKTGSVVVVLFCVLAQGTDPRHLRSKSIEDPCFGPFSFYRTRCQSVLRNRSKQAAAAGRTVLIVSYVYTGGFMFLVFSIFPNPSRDLSWMEFTGTQKSLWGCFGRGGGPNPALLFSIPGLDLQLRFQRVGDVPARATGQTAGSTSAGSKSAWNGIGQTICAQIAAETEIGLSINQ